MNYLLLSLALLPILGVLGCIIAPPQRERTIFGIALGSALFELLALATLVALWLQDGATGVSAGFGTLYSSGHFNLSLELYFDKLSAAFLAVVVIITNLVLIFSKYYMHREQGYKRFYYTLLMFLTGLALIILSGSFEVLLLGWEIIGITSVLLIAFYRDRFLPSRNALKVFSVYRIADACLIAAIWYAHHIFTSGVQFSELTSLTGAHGNQLTILGLLLFSAAMIKSAQFPFSYWVPRAMEGPTTSSAIFYGALSVHMGLFLLIRTAPLWEQSILIRVVIIAVGLLTAGIATAIARVQSSIKTQIAYASIAQIGIMFIEVALGLYWLAVMHLASNAFLRSYQLLISPSVVGYLVHDQFFYFTPPAQRIKNSILGKIRATLYILSIKEWGMNTNVTDYLWRPLKSLGRALKPLDRGGLQIIIGALVLGAAGLITTSEVFQGITKELAIVSALISIAFYVRAYATKGLAQTCWNLIMIGNLFSILALALPSDNALKYLSMYAAAILPAYLLGHLFLNHLKHNGETLQLHGYHGAIYAFNKLGHAFFIVCLVYMTFPISPAFLAQDVLLNDIHLGDAPQTALFCIAYILGGISIMRLYTKVFFGPHKTSHHELAYKSS